MDSLKKYNILHRKRVLSNLVLKFILIYINCKRLTRDYLNLQKRKEINQ